MKPGSLAIGDIVKVRHVRQYVKIKEDLGDGMYDTWSQEHAGAWHDQRAYHISELLPKRKRRARK